MDKEEKLENTGRALSSDFLIRASIALYARAQATGYDSGVCLNQMAVCPPELKSQDTSACKTAGVACSVCVPGGAGLFQAAGAARQGGGVVPRRRRRGRRDAQVRKRNTAFPCTPAAIRLKSDAFPCTPAAIRLKCDAFPCGGCVGSTFRPKPGWLECLRKLQPVGGP